MANVATQRNPMIRVMSLPDYRLLFTGTALSLLGDQFALIATPWLVLQLGGDAMALGLVLALTGLPRAGFMLIGGAITDRLSPRLVMLMSDIIRLGLTALMAIAVLTGTIEIWMVFVFSLGFGVVAGFAVPAENAIVPLLVRRSELQAGNSLMMGAGQLAGFVGPTLAGILIGTYAQSLDGIAWAYGADALSFAISGLCLFLIRGARRDPDAAASESGVFSSIAEAFHQVWHDDAMRLVFLMLAAINFLLIGPLLIGIPLVASTRLPEGAVAYGMLMSGFAAGNLVGFILAGALPRPGGVVIKGVVLAVMTGFGFVVAIFGFIPSTAIDFCMMLVLGSGNGYLAILLYTWMQTRTPRQMLGRVMSLLMFANTGLVPVSQALSGAASKWNLDLMLIIAGGLALLVTAWAATRPELTEFSDSLAQAPDTAPEGL